jgi:hypothetical protein
MTTPNQGYRKDLNLVETPNKFSALDNIGGAGISGDLAILQNNLRNTSTLAYNTISNGYFYFGASNEFVYTNDDIVTVSTNVSVGASTLVAGTTYYVCNSNSLNQFKLSTTSSTVGIATINVTSVSPTSFNFIRQDAVYQSNLANLINPYVGGVDQEVGFSYFGGKSVNTVFQEVQSNNETADYLIGSKYQSNKDKTTADILNYEGAVIINDPTSLNTDSIGLANLKSPGIFIGNTRAFSSNNNPWTKVGSALSTSSYSVSVEELYFANEITITGISTESASSVGVTTYSHKLPISVNGEIYYLLLMSN